MASVSLKRDDGTMAPVKIVRPRVSYADLEQAPEDGHRYELYDGEVFVVPAPIPRHQVVQQRIAGALQRYVSAHGGFSVDSPIDIVFSDYDVLQPDVVLFTARRAHLVDLDRVIRDAPDLCVEVLSPSTEATDRGRKMQLFARYGVPEYWIVDPSARTIEVYLFVGGAYALIQHAGSGDDVVSRVLPDLVLRAGDVFP
jgi:Uma2 family endonuclease